MPDATPVPPAPEGAVAKTTGDALAYLAHATSRAAFEAYCGALPATSGQIYWSDTHQLSDVLDGYHAALDRATGAARRATEMITEIYVPAASWPLS